MDNSVLREAGNDLMYTFLHGHRLNWASNFNTCIVFVDFHIVC